MSVKVFYTSVTGCRKIKSHQSEVIHILNSNNIDYQLIDISQDNSIREEMRSKSRNPTALPPQIFNGDDYCGDYEMLIEAVEADSVKQFLKLA
ncbi:SH3 domain-binding glutamic acid-rich-like protein 3 [Latimeria chalumnae]|uniref:SH3 domain-binding glutamic acid-rich-like protein 3 n=1 Tax=Latimeria chalumnae TaxID=7897 RepID=UPI0003C1A034|nr:PREDICTED: SH3 domain-binding glutamic acid-rich-like protein 3 [Latimeria chalumnae]|eukprot:XP_005993991.1 PREDICTED: SH3 domain-binding glutamic acid-rich-like protein 3 [Latimeria chalumnae]